MMKIFQIELGGFRGILRPIKIPCGSGFTVICGRNGTGKSTICDSIEFLLRGTLDGFREGTERGEYLSDYIWWRGKPNAENHFSRIEFRDRADKAFTIERTPENIPSDEFFENFVDKDSAPSDWVRQLCLTSIIRDETITMLSTDAPERDRYDLALRAIGVAASVAIERNVARVVKHLDSLQSAARVAYARERSKVESLTAELSQARVSAAKASKESIARLRRVYREHLDRSQEDLSELARVVAQRISRLRDRIGSLNHLQKARETLDKQREQIETPEYQERIRVVLSELQHLQTRLKAAEEHRDIALRRLQEQQAKSLT